MIRVRPSSPSKSREKVVLGMPRIKRKMMRLLKRRIVRSIAVMNIRMMMNLQIER